ncbi:MAG: SUMF1/EgtB/PvdO family nonheme iron enzyme [Phycisphaerae bacterium]|nr:SUMF1/EgtB/PvdO family nonheme iron enzyme [Phycisphaerae bacterium]
MNISKTVMSVAVLIGLVAGAASASIVIDTVPVGNPGNAGELSGEGAGGLGQDRICGAVDYTYNIGKYEVTAGQYTAFLNAVAGVDTYALYNTTMSETPAGSGITRSGGGTVGDPYTYTVASSHVNRPVNCVSWGDAARFANWLHNGQPTGGQDASTTERGAYTLDGATSDAALLAVNRNSNWKWAITSEDEWYKAAFHKNDGVTGSYWDYPTSSDSRPGRDLSDVSGNNANHNGTPYPIQSPYYTTVAGQFHNSASPYGTFDQCGNVSEWNESTLWGLYRCLRGGAFHSPTRHLRASARDPYDTPTNEATGIGFRVSAVPEPTSLALLALGGIVLARRRGLGR